jgi:hypothetical protein
MFFPQIVGIKFGSIIGTENLVAGALEDWVLKDSEHTLEVRFEDGTECRLIPHSEDRTSKKIAFTMEITRPAKVKESVIAD